MKIQLLVTKTDFCLPNLEQELTVLGLNYDVMFIEDNEELVTSHQIRHSPNVFINDHLAFRHQPTETELREYLKTVD